MRIKIQEGASRTKARDPGFDPRGIYIIIKLWVIVKRHAVGKALGEWRDEQGGAEPQPEPPFLVLERRIASAAQQAGRFVSIRKPCF